MAVSEERKRILELSKSRYQQQLKCQHEWGQWSIPYWSPKRKYRECGKCDKVESRYIPEPEWRNGSIDDRM